MNYKSRAQAISARTGMCLHLLTPEIGDPETPRVIYATADVFSTFQSPWPDTPQGDRYAMAKDMLDGFILGDMITVRENPFDPAAAIMGRTRPVTDEIFDFRCYDGSHGIRILGCFSDRDEFVALTWYFREDVVWDEAIAECKQEWQAIFGRLPPHCGRDINDYISYNVESI